MRFAEVIGHESLKRHLARAVDEGRISHAQLFTGRSGYGTLPLALAYVQYLNCTARHDGDSCGECPSCRKIAALVHPDLHFVMPVNRQGKKSGEAVLSDQFLAEWRELFARTGGYFTESMWYEAIQLENQQGLISKKEADEIIRKLSFKSFEADYKAVIVWLPERMRAEASNTILKILEEPWPKTLFLLVSESPSALLPTILSRTQEVVVPGIDPESIERFLAVRHEGAERIRAAARLSGGDLLAAEQILLGEGREEQRENFELFVELMRFSYNDRHLELIGWAEKAAGLGRERQKAFLADALRLLRESYMIGAGMERIAYLWGEELAFCRKFSPFIGNHNIENLVNEIELAAAQLRQNGNATIVFTHFALTVSKQIRKI